MCGSRWVYCYCCWQWMQKIVLHLCPSRDHCQVRQVWPSECWWKRCNNCLGKCPLFGECHSLQMESPMSLSPFYVRKGWENPKYLDLSVALDNVAASLLLPLDRRCGWKRLVSLILHHKKMPIQLM